MTNFLMTIDGFGVEGRTNFPVYNPATGEVFAQAPECDAECLERAVWAAETAFAAWRDTPVSHRREILNKFLDTLKANAPEIARILTLEQGKPLDKALSEIDAGIAFARAYTKFDLKPEVIRATPNQRVELRRRPLGVVGAITAWNYPVLLALWKIAPAVLTGNTLVVKSSPHTPLATLLLGKLTRGVFPNGVVNVISGGNEIGAQLVGHPLVRKVGFTGSARTGKSIMSAAAATLKRLTLELGGNDAGIVLEDVDPNAIGSDLFWAKFSNCGQVCAGLKRLYVHESVYDATCAALIKVAESVVVGDGSKPGTQIGPVQNRVQFDLLNAQLDEAVSAGARVLFKGTVPNGPGYFFPVTILDRVLPGMRVVREEVFGPILTIQAFDDVESAIAWANDTEYGLGGSVWSSNIERASEIAGRLESGSVWVNQHPAMGPDIPFGGIKGSGIGVECARAGMEEYTSLQVLNVKQ